VLLSATINIIAEYADIPGLIYSSKPLTTSLILLLVFRQDQPISKTYQTLILSGLGFSLLGDVLLMLPDDLFIFGLASFLVAHVFYFLAFRDGTRFQFPWVPSLVILLYGTIIFGLLFPGLGSLQVPVFAYLIVILAMFWQAWSRHLQIRSSSTVLAFVGASFFVLSDSFLAFNKFRVEFAASTALVLATYYFAQWCISQSVSWGQRLPE
jgi:uncharacterized membrane protein YhhN